MFRAGNFGGKTCLFSSLKSVTYRCLSTQIGVYSVYICTHSERNCNSDIWCLSANSHRNENEAGGYFLGESKTCSERTAPAKIQLPRHNEPRGGCFVKYSMKTGSSKQTRGTELFWDKNCSSYRNKTPPKSSFLTPFKIKEETEVAVPKFGIQQY